MHGHAFASARVGAAQGRLGVTCAKAVGMAFDRVARIQRRSARSLSTPRLAARVAPQVLQSDYSFHFEFKMTSQKLTRLYFGSRNSSTSALTLPKVVSGFWIVPLAKASIMPFLKPCPRG
jgi:hypothetical protein